MLFRVRRRVGCRKRRMGHKRGRSRLRHTSMVAFLRARFLQITPHYQRRRNCLDNSGILRAIIVNGEPVRDEIRNTE